MVSPAKRASNDKWDKEHMTILGCKVRKDYADRVRDKAKQEGTTVNTIIKTALDDFLGETEKSNPK